MTVGLRVRWRIVPWSRVASLGVPCCRHSRSLPSPRPRGGLIFDRTARVPSAPIRTWQFVIFGHDPLASGHRLILRGRPGR
jgi:hypothetical protein